MVTQKFKNKYRIPSTRLINWDYGNNAAYFVTICTHRRVHFFGQIVETRFIASPSGEIAKKIWHEIPGIFPYIQLDAFVVMPNHVHGILIIRRPDEQTGENPPNSGGVFGSGQNFNRLSTGENPPNSGGVFGSGQNFNRLPTGENPPNGGGVFGSGQNFNRLPTGENPPNGGGVLEPGLSMADVGVLGLDGEWGGGGDAMNRVSTDEKTDEKTGGKTGEHNPMSQDNLSRVVRWFKGRAAFECHKIQPEFRWQTRFHDHIIRNASSFFKIQQYILENPKKWNADRFFE